MLNTTVTQSALAKEILRLHRKREPLNISAVRRNHPHLLDAAFSFTPFLGWKQALELASLDYQSIRIELEPHIECKVCGEYFSYLVSHFRLSHGIQNAAEYRSEFPDAPILSEELRSRITWGRGSLPMWEPILSLEYILDRAWFWHSHHGSCNADFTNEHDPAIYNHAKTVGISWNDVIRRIGLDPRDECHKTGSLAKYPGADAVIKALRERHRSGLSIFQKVVVQEDNSLKSAAYTHCGTWFNAIQMAGLKSAHQQARDAGIRIDAVYPTAAATLFALQERARLAKGISQDTVVAEDNPLKSAVYRIFGSWTLAIKEAGLVSLLAEQTHRNRTRLRNTKYPTPQAVIAELKRRAARGAPLLQVNVVVDDPSLKHAAYRCFATWLAAIKAAGLKKKYDHDHPRRVVKYRDAAAVLRAIQKRHKNGQSTACNIVQKEDTKLKCAAYRLIGSWSEAKRLALDS